MDKKTAVARLVYNYFVAFNQSEHSEVELESFDESSSSVQDAFVEFVSSSVDLATGQEDTLDSN